MKLNINDEQGIELLHFIFERELKPPFRKGVKYDYCPYYNRDGETIGYLNPYRQFTVSGAFRTNIEYKVCQAFGFPRNTRDWWNSIENYVKSWLGDQLNAEITNII